MLKEMDFGYVALYLLVFLLISYAVANKTDIQVQSQNHNFVDAIFKAIVESKNGSTTSVPVHDFFTFIKSDNFGEFVTNSTKCPKAASSTLNISMENFNHFCPFILDRLIVNDVCDKTLLISSNTSNTLETQENEEAFYCNEFT